MVILHFSSIDACDAFEYQQEFDHGDEKPGIKNASEETRRQQRSNQNIAPLAENIFR